MWTDALRALRAVLWSFAGLGGRRADADTRVESVHPLLLVGVAFTVVLLVLCLLGVLAHLAAAPAGG